MWNLKNFQNGFLFQHISMNPSPAKNVDLSDTKYYFFPVVFFFNNESFQNPTHSEFLLKVRIISKLILLGKRSGVFNTRSFQAESFSFIYILNTRTQTVCLILFRYYLLLFIITQQQLVQWLCVYSQVDMGFGFQINLNYIRPKYMRAQLDSQIFSRIAMLNGVLPYPHLRLFISSSHIIFQFDVTKRTSKTKHFMQLTTLYVTWIYDCYT